MTGGTQAAAAASRRHRLTLAPRRMPAASDGVSPVCGGDGSRFRSLDSDSGASEPDEAAIPFRVAQQALEGEEEDGWTVSDNNHKPHRNDVMCSYVVLDTHVLS
jgi:hypothetical protein